MCIFSELDWKLIKALTDYRFNDAEKHIADGADINAYSEDDDGCASIISEAVWCDSDIFSIVDFALTHGLDPTRHEGKHILMALYAFVLVPIRDRELLAFKSLINTGVDLSKKIDFDEPYIPRTLDEFIDYRLGIELSLYEDQESASSDAVYREVVLAKLHGEDYNAYLPCKSAIGKRVNRVLLFPEKGTTVTTTETSVNRILFLGRDRPNLALDLGDSALLFKEGLMAYLVPIRKLDESLQEDVSSLLPSISKAKIIDAVFPENDEPPREFCTSVLFDNDWKFSVELKSSNQLIASATHLNACQS